jgi:2-polyprenyl-3-methyl-5-hydroxy-6-metoxy-1,4-benzoquinol methylase
MLPSANQFAQRTDPSLLPEWMDEPCSYEEFRACLIDLAKVNRTLHAYRPIVNWIANLPPQREPLHIVDVGCGGGDLLRHIADWAARKRIPVQLTGVDMNPMSIRAAAEFSKAHPQIQWITGQAQRMQNQADIDIVTSSLCTHHMSNSEITQLLQWMELTAQRGWFLSDLRRSRTNYILFSLLSRLARWHRFVQHDGPVSIRRSFSEHDWQRLCIAAGVTNMQIQRSFPGRLCVSKTRD